MTRLQLLVVLSVCVGTGCTGSGSVADDGGSPAADSMCGGSPIGQACDCGAVMGKLICNGGSPWCDCPGGGGGPTGGGDGDSGGGGTATDGCPASSPGCSCTVVGTCDGALSCVSGYCVDDTSGDACPIGSQGCACTQGGSCDGTLSCPSGYCVVESSGGDGDGSVVPPPTGGAWAPCMLDTDCADGRSCTRATQELIVSGRPGQCVMNCSGADVNSCDATPAGAGAATCVLDDTGARCAIGCVQSDCPAGWECIPIPAVTLVNLVCILAQ